MPESDARSLEEGAGKRCSECDTRILSLTLPPFAVILLRTGQAKQQPVRLTDC